MKFSYSAFMRFARQLKIDSKEQGVRPLFPLKGTQEFFLQEVVKGIEDGVHEFWTLKGRQTGITTICWALVDLYWLLTHDGIHGHFIADDESNRDQAKATLTLYMESLPVGLKIPVEAHNRIHLVLANRSRLFYSIAGTQRKKGRLGQGKGVAVVHGTECASWADQAGLASLSASKAKRNPDRLYVFESTALGFNEFYNQCESAKQAITKRMIFIGWWLDRDNWCARDSKPFEAYWDGKVTKQEREWILDVKRQYGYEIQPEQIAWWRLQLFEEYAEIETDLMQEYPPTEDRAWVLTGSKWFNSKILTEAWTAARKVNYEAYSYHFGQQFFDTILWPTTERKCELKVWEKPEAGAHYIVSCDPAYGGSANADNFVVSVTRAYADGLDDVAEFATPEIDTYACAWVVCHLAGYYGQLPGSHVTVNIEANGPGRAVIDEIRNLRRQSATHRGTDQGEARDIKAAVKHMSWYLYRRPDSLGGPTSYIGSAITSNPEMKNRMMNVLRDCVHRGLYNVRSLDCIAEMRTIVKEPAPDNDIHAEGSAKDDRVMARGMTAITWFEQVRGQLEARHHTRESVARASEGQPERTPMENVMENYFKNIAFTEKLAKMGTRLRPNARRL